MSDVTVKVGLNGQPFKTGLDKLRGDLSGWKREQETTFAGLGSKLAGAFAGAGVAAAFGSVIEKASRFNDVAERFGIGSEGLQRIGNAAQQNGSSIEAVAGAMNKLAINQEKVRTGDEAMAQSLEDLKISASDFINLSPEDAFYKIAEAVSSADDRGKAYGAVVSLMGRTSGELFTTLEMGAGTIQELGNRIGVMSEESIQTLDGMGDKIDEIKAKLNVGLANTGSYIIKMVESAAAIAAGVASEIGEMFSGQEGNGALSTKQQMDEIWNPKREERKPRAQREAEDATSTAAEQKQSKLAVLRERLDDMKKKNQAEELEGEEKINSLVKQRSVALAQAVNARELRGDEEGAINFEIEAESLKGKIAEARHAAAKKFDDDFVAKGKASARLEQEAAADRKKNAEKIADLESQTAETKAAGRFDALDLDGQIASLAAEIASKTTEAKNADALRTAELNSQIAVMDNQLANLKAQAKAKAEGKAKAAAEFQALPADDRRAAKRAGEKQERRLSQAQRILKGREEDAERNNKANARPDFDKLFNKPTPPQKDDVIKPDPKAPEPAPKLDSIDATLTTIKDNITTLLNKTNVA